MKLAVISPPHIGELYSSGYHFALGQKLVTDEMYRRRFREFRRRGDFIIVDNGAAEKGEERLPFEDILNAALHVEADEIILPDYLQDKANTMDQSFQWAPLLPRRQRFVVPQGKTWEEWKTCLVALVHHCRPVTIGIPKWIDRELPGGRPHALELVKELGYHNECNIHLLGIHLRPFAEVYKAWNVLHSIRGIDTAAPIAYAQHGVTISDAVHHSLDWKADADMGVAQENVFTYKHSLNIIEYKEFLEHEA
jgi:hypothetical protein